MRLASLLLLACCLLSAVCFDSTTQTPLPGNSHRSLSSMIDDLDEQLQALDPSFIANFVAVFHNDNSTHHWIQAVETNEGAYYVLVAKMYLYGLLTQTTHPALQMYRTQAPYLAAYFYLQVAARQHTNSQAYYWLGLLEHFKLVPDKVLQTNLQRLNRTKAQNVLLKHLKTSHLNNAEHNLFMAAALAYDPATLVLGHMNREPFGTALNCTTALAYYLAVLKRHLFQPYTPKLVIDVSYSLEDELFAMKPLTPSEQPIDHSFVMETTYFDEETISATLEQANRHYTGSRGVVRNLEKALQLFEKLAQQGNSDGKIMAGLMYFRGEGTPRNVAKAQHMFSQTPKDEVAEYMLLVMDYFEMLMPNTKQRALKTMQKKISGKERLSQLLNFLIGSAALKGELKEVTHEQAIEMIDKSAAEGNPSARLLMAILFADGAKGLKYGCLEATKYLSEDAIYHPYFSRRVNMAEVALRRGSLTFSFFKYFELQFNSYQTAFINSLYLLQMYSSEVLPLKEHSWQPGQLTKSGLYLQLRDNRMVPDIYSFLLQNYSPVGLRTVGMGELDKLLAVDEEVIKAQLAYMQKKIVKRGVVAEKRGMLKYYEYKLALEEGASIKQLQPILSTLASGDSSKLFVLEARYLLGQLYHGNALKNKSELTKQQTRKVMGQYNRAVKSEVLGQLIFEIEQYKLTGDVDFELAQTAVGQDLLAYIFFLAILAFILYYLRSKRFDQFHRAELERQLRRAQEQSQSNQEPPSSPQERQEEKQEDEGSDRNQPVITDDPEPAVRAEPQGIRIGSSSEEELS